MFIQKAERTFLENEPEFGIPTGYEENRLAVFDDTYTNRATMSLQYEFYDAYLENVRDIEQKTGQKFTAPFIDVEVYKDVARDLEGEERNVNFLRSDTIRKIHSQNEEIKKLKSQYPDIKTLDEVWQGVKANAAEVSATADDVSSRATFMGSVGGLVGAMTGAFSFRDPYNLGTLGVAGAGRTLVLRLLTEAGAQGAIESVNQFFGVRSNRELLGLDNSLEDSLFSIAAAAGGGAVLRAGGEGLVKLSNTELLKKATEKFKKPNSNQKLALDILEKEIEFNEKANPFGDDLDGETMHLERMREAEETLEGSAPAGRERLDETPIVRDVEAQSRLNEIDDATADYRAKAEDIKVELKKATSADLKKPESLRPVIGYTPKSLIEFIRENGGINDAGGDLASMGINNATTKKPFKRSLIREEENLLTEAGTQKVKNSPDVVRERVYDAGYFPEKASYDEITDDELFAAIADDLNPETSKIYSDADAKIITEKTGQDANVNAYDEIGITEDMSVDEIAERLKEEDFYNDVEGDFPDFDARAYDEQARYEAAQRAEGSQYLDDVSEGYVDSQLEDLKAADDFNPDDEIIVGHTLDDEGNPVAEIMKLGDLIKGIEEDNALIKASKGCVL